MVIQKVFYSVNNQEFIATGEILSEDNDFITIDDRYEGKVRIGKKFIIKIKNEGVNDGLAKRT